MTGLFLCLIKKEAEMKMLMAVLVVRVIISIFEKKEKATAEKMDNSKRIIHPAEFEIR